LLSIENDDITIHKTLSDIWTDAYVGCELTGKFFLVPKTNKSFEIESLASSDPSVIEITDIDYDNNTYKAIAKKEGSAKLRIITENYGSCTTMRIDVRY
jgi:hypothetical protein